MGKSSKLIAIVLFVLGLACIGMYFVMGDGGNEFKVTFDSAGGTSVAEQIVKKGEKANKPEDPTKDGSEFVAWTLDGGLFDFDIVPITKNITLIAKWSEFVTHTVTVKMGENDYTASIKDGELLTIEALNIPEKEGYRVKLTNEDKTEFDLTKPISEDVALTAEYVEIQTFTVKFDSQGGSKVSDEKVTEGSTVKEPSVTRDGYTLDGWYLENEKFDFTTPITKNITLKARWTENGKVNVIFMVDEKVYKTIGVKENTKVTKPANPYKKGYKFVEWQLNGSAFDFNTKITAETTLTATFEESKTKTVSFDSNGGSKVATQEVEDGAKAKKPANPTKEGYKFVEWQLNGKTYDFNKEVTDDLALKAVWVKVYTVTFNDYDGKKLSTQEVAEGEKVTKPKDPTREGYKFVEWLSESKTYNFNTAVKSDLTLTAFYEKAAAPTPTPTPSATPTPTPTPEPSEADVVETNE